MADSMSNRGPERPASHKANRFLQVIEDTLTPADWKAIIQKAIEQAIEGQSHAVQFLAQNFDRMPWAPMDPKNEQLASIEQVVNSLPQEQAEKVRNAISKFKG